MLLCVCVCVRVPGKLWTSDINNAAQEATPPTKLCKTTLHLCIRPTTAGNVSHAGLEETQQTQSIKNVRTCAAETTGRFGDSLRLLATSGRFDLLCFTINTPGKLLMSGKKTINFLRINKH